MSTYHPSDPCTDMILNFISVGESAGNYNAVIGDAHSQVDLSQMRITDIRNLQRQLVNNGQPSSAVGRYQIIEATLDTLCQELAIEDDELFTPTVQDQCALQLLIGRGYRSWWRGEVSNETFAHGLSCEWASLPDPRNGGKSHYDGVGQNHAGQTLETVYATLARAKAAIINTIDVQAEPVAVDPPAPSRLATIAAIGVVEAARLLLHKGLTDSALSAAIATYDHHTSS